MASGIQWEETPRLVFGDVTVVAGRGWACGEASRPYLRVHSPGDTPVPTDVEEAVRSLARGLVVLAPASHPVGPAAEVQVIWPDPEALFGARWATEPGT